MKIYTRTGDKGTTGLYGGDRVSKASLRMHAYGTIDELNACLGVIVSMQSEIPQPVQDQLTEVQQELFAIGADLATPLHSKANILRTSEEAATIVEGWIDGLERELPPLTQFIFPSGALVGAEMHRARTICRRAERYIAELSEREPITMAVMTYVNRLGDYLFVAARYVNRQLSSPERVVFIKKAKPDPAKDQLLKNITASKTAMRSSDKRTRRTRRAAAAR